MDMESSDWGRYLDDGSDEISYGCQVSGVMLYIYTYDYGLGLM